MDSVAECRDRVTSFLRDLGIADDQLDEIRLVVSELASNVVRHSDRPTIEVSLAATRTDIVVELPGAPTDVVPAAPSRSQFSGRGLLIVRNVADDVSMVERDDERFVRCRFERRPSAA